MGEEKEVVHLKIILINVYPVLLKKMDFRQHLKIQM